MRLAVAEQTVASDLGIISFTNAVFVKTRNCNTDMPNMCLRSFRKGVFIA